MTITEAIIRNRTSGQSFERGNDYYHTGAVLDLQKRGNTLLAQVEGSDYDPYEVTVKLEPGQISTECTCPYDWGGDCKHIVAVLLTYLRQSERVSERPPIEDLLAGLGETDLRELLFQLLSTEPRLVNWVEGQLAIQTAPKQESHIGQARPRQTSLDATAFRRQAQSIMMSHDHRWGEGSDVPDRILDLARKADPFIEGGDGRNALLVLEPIAEIFVDSWHEVDHYGEDSATVFEAMGAMFAEAILSVDLSAAECKALAHKMTLWQGELSNYGLDDVGFDAAIAAAEQGWAYPPLQKVLEGHITEKGAWEGEAPWYADDLTLARLNVLERQGRTTEYLYLAEAEGQTALYLTMLVKAGRGEESVAYAKKYMATADESLALAQALREHQQPMEALEVAERGLSLSGQTTILARWLRDFSAEMFQPEISLRAARATFTETFSVEDYQAVKIAAGAKWPVIKPEILQLLAKASTSFTGKIEIYLQEGMVDEAVRAFDHDSYISYHILEPVVEAAWQSHPVWVIKQCQRQAEPIMDKGQSGRYHHAVRWLERARRSYLAMNRADDWSRYLERVISKHARKYSLRPRLEELRV